MIMRPLLIDDEARARVREVLSFASKNWYRLGRSEIVPGDDPRHTVLLNTYRCVFSYTLDPHDNLWRHLSISVPSKDLPNPFAFYSIAELFDFTGWDGKSIEPPPEGWILGVNKQEHCITAVQKAAPL